MSVEEIPLHKVQLIGMQGPVSHVLGEYSLIDPTKRDEIQKEIFTSILSQEWVVFGNTMFKRDDYDAFKLLSIG